MAGRNGNLCECNSKYRHLFVPEDGSGTTVFRTSFYSVSNTSDISKRTYKAGGSNYETVFYVTPTYFSSNVRYFAASFRLKTYSQYGVDIGLTKANTNVTHKGAYYITPPKEEYYYLYGTYDAAVSSGPAIYVEGRFTP